MNESETVEAQQPEWELSKENFQPLKGGRKPTGLQDRPVLGPKLGIDEQRAYVVEMASPPLKLPHFLTGWRPKKMQKIR